MQITVTDDAKKLLDKHCQNNTSYLLTMNDGVSKYLGTDSCASVCALQLIVLNHKEKSPDLDTLSNSEG